MDVPFGEDTLQCVADGVFTDGLRLFHVDERQHARHHGRNGDPSHDVGMAVARLFGDAGEPCSVKRHTLEFAHAHPRIEQDEQRRVPRILRVIAAKIHDALFLCLGEGVAFLDFIVRQHDLAHGRAQAAALADDVEDSSHQHFEFLRRAIFALVRKREQKVLYVLAGDLVDVHPAETGQKIERNEVFIALVRRRLDRLLFDFEPILDAVPKERVTRILQCFLAFGELLQELVLHRRKVFGGDFDVVLAAAQTRLVVAVFGDTIGHDVFVDRKQFP